MRTRIVLLLLAAVTVVAWSVTAPASTPEAAAGCRSSSADVVAAPVRDNVVPTIDVLARGTDNALWHRWWKAGEPWTCWQRLGGDLAAGGGIASHGTGILHLVALGSDGRIKDRSFENENVIRGGWSNWVDLGEQQFSAAPAIASWGSNHLEVFAKGTDDRIWHNWYQFGAGRWSGWYAFDGEGFTSAPAAVAYDTERLHVFAKGADDRIYSKHHAGGGSWSDWYPLGTQEFASAPAAVSWGPQHLEVFARGTDNRIWHTWYRFGTGWSDWYPLDGGSFVEAPAAVTHAPETLNVYALGTDGRMWERYHLGGGQWSPWKVFGEERFTSAPFAGSWSNR
jgi:Repeat of unknown function (DUF346)